MGYNSVVLVLNDRLNEISRADFGHRLADAIRECGGSGGEPVDVRGQAGQTQVLSCQHADIMQIVAVGGNTGRLIGTGFYADSDEVLLQKMAKRAGFKLVPESQKGQSLDRKPTLEEVKELAKEYGHRLIVLRRKGQK